MPKGVPRSRQQGFQYDIIRFGKDSAPLNRARRSKRKQAGERLWLNSATSGPSPKADTRSPAPKLPRSVTYGETLGEAQANAREAIELCLEVMREDGQTHSTP